MRRGLLLAGIAALLVTFGLWLAATVDRSPLTRSHGNRRIPAVVAGRDLASDEAPPPVRGGEDEAVLRCRFGGDGEPGVLVAMGDQVVEGAASGGDLNLRVPAGTWSILWQTADGKSIPLGSIQVEAGEVYTCALDNGGWDVSGTVRTSAGRALAGVEVNACGDVVETDADGRFRAKARSRACRVRAVFRDGILARRSETVTVGPFDARDLALTVDDGPIAGMGIAFRMVDAGARVLQVHALTPAEEAGVEPGDIILSVDGTRTQGLTDDAFIALGTGPEGSRVTLELDRDGERLTVSFQRERLERLEDTGPG